MEKIKKVWALALDHPKIAIAIVAVVVLVALAN